MSDFNLKRMLKRNKKAKDIKQLQETKQQHEKWDETVCRYEKYASDENEGLEWDGVTEVMNYKEQEARDRERKEAWEKNSSYKKNSTEERREEKI